MLNRTLKNKKYSNLFFGINGSPNVGEPILNLEKDITLVSNPYLINNKVENDERTDELNSNIINSSNVKNVLSTRYNISIYLYIKDK
jgi:hypothetical protein